MRDRFPFLPENAEAAKKGLIKHLARSGGSCPIGDLHTFSTQRYGAGHQAFSALMEWLVADGVLLYDGSTFHLTDKGLELSKGMLF